HLRRRRPSLPLPGPRRSHLRARRSRRPPDRPPRRRRNPARHSRRPPHVSQHHPRRRPPTHRRNVLRARHTRRHTSSRPAAQRRTIDFSLTTNATLLTPEIIAFLSENHIGVTVSMDGPKEMHDQLRVFANGRGSYDIIEPRVRALIGNHRTRPITARVTLTSGVTDVARIYQHLKHDLGFHEVGFAPVTTSPKRLYAIG